MAKTCDQCRMRKIKCEGGDPCLRCQKSELACSRLDTVRRRGPKTGNGRVIHKIRNDQHQTHDTSSTAAGIDLDQTVSASVSTTPTKEHDSIFSNEPATNVSQNVTMDSKLLHAQGDGSILHIQRIEDTASGFSSPMSSGGLNNPSHNFHNSFSAQKSNVDNFQNLSALPKCLSVGFFDQQGLNSRSSASPMGTSTSVSICDDSAVPRSHPSQPFIETSSNVHDAIAFPMDSYTCFEEPALIKLAQRINLPALLLSQCIKQYFRYLYPVLPVLDESSFVSFILNEPILNGERECLLLSLCALTVLRTPLPYHMGNRTPADIARMLISTCKEVRSVFEWVEEASLMTAISSFFLSISYYDLDQKKSYEFYLHEASLLCHGEDLRLDFAGPDTVNIGKALHERLLVLIYITQRAGGVHLHKATSFLARPSLPITQLKCDDGPILCGLEALTKMFDVVNQEFMTVWLSSSCGVEPGNTHLSKALTNKHDIDQLSIESSSVSENQLPDILVTIQWLKLLHWQICLKQGLVSSSAQNPALTYRYPMNIARDLCTILQSLPMELVFCHGRGIIEKIFDVTYSLADCLAVIDILHKSSPESLYLQTYISLAPRLHQGFSDVLREHIKGYSMTSPAM